MPIPDFAKDAEQAVIDAESARADGREDEARALYERAAELFEKAGMLREAADCWSRAPNDARAKAALIRLAEDYVQKGRHGLAGHAFSEADEFRRAAAEFEKAGEHEYAGNCYVKLKDHEAAARQFERAKAHAKAAEQWDLSGNGAKAAPQWMKVGDLTKSAKSAKASGNPNVIERVFDAWLQSATSESEPDMAEACEAVAEKLLWAQPGRAAELFARAARAWVVLGEGDKAEVCTRFEAEAWDSAGSEARAALAYSRLLDTSKAPKERLEKAASIALEAGDLATWAELTAKLGGDPTELKDRLCFGAVDAFRTNAFERAAQIWTLLGDYAAAAGALDAAVLVETDPEKAERLRAQLDELREWAELDALEEQAEAASEAKDKAQAALAASPQDWRKFQDLNRAVIELNAINDKLDRLRQRLRNRKRPPRFA